MRLATTLLVLTLSANTWAGAALDDDKKATPPPNGEAAPVAAATSDTAPATSTEDPVTYGIDLRLRNVRIPKGMLEWFMSHAADGASNFGYGIDLIRRRGNLELSLGLEFEHINIGEGVYIEKNKNVAVGDPVDYIIGPDHAPNGDNLGWFTVEFNFINHAPINKYVSFRYGGGAGLGILTGALYRWDVVCGPGATNDNPTAACTPGDVSYLSGGGHTADDSNGGKETVPAKYDLPPVFPVINAIIGVQIKPFDKAIINIEGGIRTMPFIGMSFGYFLD